MLPFCRTPQPPLPFLPSGQKPGWYRGQSFGIRQISRWPSLRLCDSDGSPADQSVFTLRAEVPAACRCRTRSASPASPESWLISDNLPPAQPAERVQLREFRRWWDHLSRGVPASWCRSPAGSSPVQRQILYVPAVCITHHLGFAVIAVEHRMSQRIASSRSMLFLNGAGCRAQPLCRAYQRPDRVRHPAIR